MKSLLSIVVLVFSLNSWSSEDYVIERSRGTITISNMDLKIRSSDTKLVTLSGLNFVTRMAIKVRRCAFSSGGRLTINLNGQEIRAVDVKRDRGDRTYFVPVERYVEYLELRNDFNRGCLKVKEIKMIRSFNNPNQIPGAGQWQIPVVQSDAYAEVSNLKFLFDEIATFVAPEDRTRYLDHLYVVLGNALSVLESGSDLSSDATRAVSAVISEINGMDEFLNRLLSIYNTQDAAREVKSSARRLHRMVAPL